MGEIDAQEGQPILSEEGDALAAPLGEHSDRSQYEDTVAPVYDEPPTSALANEVTSQSGNGPPLAADVEEGAETAASGSASDVPAAAGEEAEPPGEEPVESGSETESVADETPVAETVEADAAAVQPLAQPCFQHCLSNLRARTAKLSSQPFRGLHGFW